MNVIDLLLLLIILLSVWSGYQKGFVRGALDLLTLALGLVFAFRVSPYAAAFLEKQDASIGIWTLPLAFILCYFFARILLTAVAVGMISSIRGKSQPASAVNNALGILPGFVNGLINAAIISALLLALPLSDGLSGKTRDSAIAAALTPYVDWAEEKLAPVFDEAVNHTINRLTVDPASNKSVELPFSAKSPKIREDLEAEMLLLVNREREKAGLPALKADPEMQLVARAHARDMFARSYFSHINPEGKSPADRARAAHVRFLAAGENLALAQTLDMAHTGLMNSPGHRANILHKAFSRVGIGILDGGRHGLMVTQNFRN